MLRCLVFVPLCALLPLKALAVYDPTIGVWMSRDPLPNAELSQGPNPYTYVANNPVNAIDPLGLITLVVGLTGQGGGFIPAGPNAQVTPVAVGISYSFANGFHYGALSSAGTGLQVLPSYSRSVFGQITNAPSLDALKGGGYNAGVSGGEEVVLGGDVVTGWANGRPSPSTYVGLQLSAGLGGGFPIEGHADANYTVGGINRAGSGNFSPGGGNFGCGHGAGGTW